MLITIIPFIGFIISITIIAIIITITIVNVPPIKVRVSFVKFKLIKTKKYSLILYKLNFQLLNKTRISFSFTISKLKYHFDYKIRKLHFILEFNSRNDHVISFSFPIIHSRN